MRYWDADDDARPVSLKYKLGTAVFYRMDVHHQATPVAEGRTQLSLHLTIKRKVCEWVQYDTFVTPLSGHRDMVAMLSPDQRSAIGKILFASHLHPLPESLVSTGSSDWRDCVRLQAGRRLASRTGARTRSAL